MSDKKVIMVRGNEPLLISWARGAVTFGGLIGTALALNLLMPPSGWLNFALSVVWILWLIGRSARHKSEMTPSAARAWLNANYPDVAPTPEATDRPKVRA